MSKRLPPGEGKLYALNTKTTRELRERLEVEAGKSGRSLTSEVEHRLEASFRAHGATLEQVRTIIGDELRAALREERTGVHVGYSTADAGSNTHTFGSSYEHVPSRLYRNDSHSG